MKKQKEGKRNEHENTQKNQTISRQTKHNQATITVNPNGTVSFEQPAITGLALSGGGAKGVAYAGMIKRLDMTKITHVSGASAGAMTASAIATGMSKDDLKTLLLNFDLTKITKPSKFRASGERFQAAINLIYLHQLNSNCQLTNQITSKALTRKIASYQDFITQALGPNKTATMNDLITIMHDSTKYPNAADFPPELATFKDFNEIKAKLPPEQAQKIKNLYIVATNVTQNKEKYTAQLTLQMPQ